MAFLSVDKDLAAYYYGLIPKWMNIVKPGRPPHVTVCRPGVDAPDMRFWGKYEGEVVEFHYDPEIVVEPQATWINVYSKRLEAIRVELGLSVTMRTILPPFLKKFHITIGK